MVFGQATRDDLIEALAETRERTLALVEPLGEFDLARVISPLLSPLLWDLGHIANFQQRWLIGTLGGDPLDGVYDPFETPRAKRGELPFLHSEDCFAYMEAVSSQVAERIDEVDPYKAELVIQHEQQHNETMLQLLRMLDRYEPPGGLRRSRRVTRAASGSGHWIDVPAASYAIGSSPASNEEFVYDNEMSAHQVDLRPFQIARLPVTNGEFAEWIATGGYTRERWWSPEGRAWLAGARAEAPLGWTYDGREWCECGFGDPRPLDPLAPVTHVNWWEAEAYARAQGARLPSEFEWEVAAGTDLDTGERSLSPWGDDRWREGMANLDQTAFGTVACGAESVTSPAGCVDMAGQVWEWTASQFSAYPGFEPFCYDRYSAPFFGQGYRVLRGGSWATRPRTVNARFRNWDHPERRQIFAGFRLARD